MKTVTKLAMIGALTLTLGCTNMSSEQQGTLSGAAIGAAAGAGISAMTGGHGGVGAAIGGVLGGISGDMYARYKRGDFDK